VESENSADGFRGSLWFGSRCQESLDKNHTLTGEQLQKVEPQVASTSAPSAKWKESHFKAKWSGTKVAEIAKFIQVNRDANGTMDTQSIQSFLSVRVEHLEKLITEHADIFEVTDKGGADNGRVTVGQGVRIRLTKEGEECAYLGPPLKRHRTFGPATLYKPNRD